MAVGYHAMGKFFAAGFVVQKVGDYCDKPTFRIMTGDSEHYIDVTDIVDGSVLIRFNNAPHLDKMLSIDGLNGGSEYSNQKYVLRPYVQYIRNQYSKNDMWKYKGHLVDLFDDLCGEPSEKDDDV